MDYQDYLKTEDWDTKRKATYKKAKHRCQACKTHSEQLHAHHIKYRDLFHVSVAKELICLCKGCHFLLHDLMNAGDFPTWPEYYKSKPKATKKKYRKLIKKTLLAQKGKKSTTNPILTQKVANMEDDKIIKEIALALHCSGVQANLIPKSHYGPDWDNFRLQVADDLLPRLRVLILTLQKENRHESI